MNQVQVAASRPRPKYRKSNAEKAASEQEHLSLVLTAAETAINILHQHHLPAAIFGSLACKLYGNLDADILVLPPANDINAEILKSFSSPQPQSISISRMRVIPLPPIASSGSVRHAAAAKLKSTSGPRANVSPHIPLPRIRWISGLPLAPFCFILLHKLKGWADHRDAPEGFKRVRQSTDAADVRRLLDIVTEMQVLQATPSSWYQDLELFDAELQADSVVRVRSYCLEFPGRAERWRSLGFDVPEPDAVVVSNPDVTVVSDLVVAA
ncbi:hypothetical protein K438DRAFT_1819390 [Mycena galopus ATCC 62051]|nr:hypothetical protein K438DRAFT_1819390 [Mycena galopus ATCC 62051]